MTEPLAAFDVLQLTGTVGKSADGVTESELHALAYLACLMAVYDGREPPWWGYGFTVTRSGAPFARAVADALGELQRVRWLVGRRVLRLDDRGYAELDFEKSLALNVRRLRYLDAATAAALSLPLPALTDALAHEPGLRRALQYLRRKQLLDASDVDLVTKQFTALTDALNQDPADWEDLMVPTVVWLTYLARTRGVLQAA